jgi:endonuclease-3
MPSEHETSRQPVTAAAGTKPVVRPRSAAGRARLAAERLATEYPGSAPELCALGFADPWQLLVATVLSAQTTDERVNAVTPLLFSRYPGPADLAAADPSQVEAVIRPTGFFRSKTRHIVALAGALEDRFDGRVPARMDDLVTLPGVGRKTANVVLSVAFGRPGLAVDTHVKRLSRLLGLTTNTDPDKIETDLCAALPSREWGAMSLRLILHGRRVCIANRPRCTDCVLADFCPSAAVPVRTAPAAPRASGRPAGAAPAPGKAQAPATRRSNLRLATPKVRSTSRKSVP